MLNKKLNFCLDHVSIATVHRDRPIDLCTQLGFVTAAMALRKDTVSIRNPRLTSAPKLAVILGTEGEGLHPETIAQSDYTVCIPMAHGVDSLNVAAATAVAFWQLCEHV